MAEPMNGDFRKLLDEEIENQKGGSRRRKKNKINSVDIILKK